jgi:hypothetical protein
VNLRTLTTMSALAMTALSCESPTDILVVPGEGPVRLTNARVTIGPSNTLVLRAALENRSAASFVSGGCRSPSIVIDSASASGNSWLPFDALQEVELIQCIAPFNVSPGRSQNFETRFVRSSPGRGYPRNAVLRFRVLTTTPGIGEPTLPVVLPP